METFDKHKAEGLQAFSSKRWLDAKNAYLQAARIAGISAEQAAIVLANGAACCIKLAEFDEAVTLATESLDSKSNYVKALYRRAQVSFHPKLHNVSNKLISTGVCLSR